jgi:Zn-dependent protease with chaperone function
MTMRGSGLGVRYRGFTAMVVAVLALAFSRGVARAAEPSPYEKRIEVENDADIAAAGAEARALWAEADRRFEANDAAGAKEQLEKLVVLAPSLDHGFRFLCMTNMSLRQQVAAAEACRKAVALRPSSRNRTRLALVLMQNPGARDEASSILAQGFDQEDELGRSVECELALHRTIAAQVDRGFVGCTERLVASFPASASAHGLRVQGLLVADDMDAAEDELARAKALGLPQPSVDEYAHLISQGRGFVVPLLKKFAIFAVSWFGALLALWFVGALLSARALRAVEVAMQGTLTPISRGERRLRQLYRAAVGVTGAYFFASLPVIAVVTLLSVALVFVLCFYLGQIPVKLLLVIGFIALVSVWSMGKSLVALFRNKEKDPGEELHLSAEPKLANLLRGVADDLGTRPVDRVFVTQGTDMAVYERGGPLTTLRGKGERCLILGVGLLDGFQVRPFKSIVAHEYGHFKNEDTAGGHLALAVRRSILHMAEGMVKGGAATAINPAWWFIRGYHRVFHRITQGASRLQEVLADRAAVLTYGSEAFSVGFRHVIAREAAFGLHADATVTESTERKIAVANFYRFEPTRPPSEDDVADKVEAGLAAPHSEDDSHPPPRARLDLAAKMNLEGSVPCGPDDGDAVWSLFSDREALEVRMTARIREAVLENLGVDLSAPG